MVNADYDTEGAVTGVRKFNYENRGPITRWFGYVGSYMPTEQRVEFLKSMAEKIKDD